MDLKYKTFDITQHNLASNETNHLDYNHMNENITSIYTVLGEYREARNETRTRAIFHVNFFPTRMFYLINYISF